MRLLVGSMQFPALVLSPPSAPSLLPLSEYTDEKKPGAVEAGRTGPSRPLKLWGLTLGMTLDLLAYMAPTPITPWDADALMGITGVEPAPGQTSASHRRSAAATSRRGVRAPPSLTSVFPRFSYPDVNFWIW